MTQPAFLSISLGAGAPPDPYDSPEAWDYVRVAGQLSPWICDVRQFKRKWDWDEKHPKGSKNSYLTFTGNHLARGSIEFWLLCGPDPNNLGFNYAHLAQWYRFSQLFKYDPTKTIAQPVDIYHPSLAMIGLTSIVCEDIHNPVRRSIGLYSVEVSLIEYGPPPPVSVVSTPLTSAPNSPAGVKGPPGVPPDPAGDALQKRIAAQITIAQAPLPSP
jgi:hypothetical protein